MASNLKRRSASECLGATLAGGEGWRLTEVSHYQCFDSPNSTRSSPTTLWRCGDLDSLTLGWQRTVVAADDGEATQRKLSINGGELWGSSS
jgi:hypothetical protein